MGMMTLQQALGFVRQRIPSAHLVGDGATPLARVHTDTRTLQAGDLFVALKGERFDANAFLPQAKASGAAAALAHGGVAAAGLSGIEVPDTLAAFGALAAGWRAQFTLPLIGVTGSNGKTTVTPMRMLAFSAPLKPVDMMSGHISTCSSVRPSGMGARLACASGTSTYSAWVPSIRLPKRQPAVALKPWQPHMPWGMR